MRLALIAPFLLLAACFPQADSVDAPAAPPVAAAPPSLEVEADERSDAQFEEVIASVNPLENDLRGLEVAIQLEDAFVVKPDGVDLRIAAKSADGTVVLDETYVLAVLDAPEAEFLAPLSREGYAVHTFQLALADRARMADMQERLKALRQAAPGRNELTFSATARTCVAQGRPAPDALRFRVFLRSARMVDFVDVGGESTFRPGDGPGSAVLFAPCEG